MELAKNLGFNVGLIGDLRINRFLNLRLEPGYIILKEIYFTPTIRLHGSENLVVTTLHQMTDCEK